MIIFDANYTIRVNGYSQYCSSVFKSLYRPGTSLCFGRGNRESALRFL